MKIPSFIVAIALTAMISVQSWTLVEVVNLKVSLAALNERVSNIQTKTAHESKNEILPLAQRN